MSHQEQPTTYTDWPGRNHGLFLHDGVYSELIDYPYYAGDEIHTNNVVFRNSSYVTYDNTHSRHLNKSDIHLYDTSGVSIYDSGTFTVYTSASPTARGFVVDSLGRVGIGMAHEQPHSNDIESPSFDLDVKGSVGVEHYIYHNDDVDTYILFGSDQVSHFENTDGVPDMSTSVDYDEINIRTGGVDMLQIKTDTTQNDVMINKYMSDVDFTVRTQTNSAALVVYGDGSEVVVNEDGLSDTDFRVESDNSGKILFTDSSENVVEIHGPADDDSDLFVVYGNSDDNFAGQNLFRVNPNQVVFNEDSNAVDFRVESDGSGIFQNTTDIGTDGGVQTHLAHNPTAALFVDGSTGHVGLGTTSPDTTLHIAGSAHIEGDLWVKGNTNQIDTLVHMTSAVDITNKGTGPALNVNQTGINPIATFRDDGRDILYIEDGGDVGFQTTNPHTSVYIEDSDGIRIPIGDTASRPLSGAFGINGDPVTADFTAMYGTIRYNTQYQTFEGFGPGNAWGSLGGVIDIDRDTFWTALNDISGSEYPGDPDTLRAYVGHDNNPSETNGMLMMTISANKTIIHRPNVGIGTMNPQGELHIKGGEDGSRPVQLVLEGPKQNFSSPFPQSMGQIAFTSSESAIDVQTGVAKIEARATKDFDPMSFGSEIGIHTTPYGGIVAEERVTIKDTGQVGIGTMVPFSDYKLHVTGKTRIGNNDNITPFPSNEGHLTVDGSGYRGQISLDESSMWIGHNSNIRDLTFATSRTPRMTIKGEGNVGIGTTVPDHKLKVIADDSNYAGYFKNDSTSGSGIVSWTPNCTDPNKFVAYLEGHTLDLGLYVKPSGKVGVGTRSPSGDLTIDPKNPSSSSTTGSPLTILNPANSVSMYLGNYAITSGYSPNSYSGAIRFAGADTAWGDFSYYPTGGDDNEYGHFRFARSGSAVVTTPNAKVGMGDLFVNSKAGFGTTNPQARAEIQVPYVSSLNTYTENVENAGLLISSSYSSGTYVPGLTWQTDNNNSTKTKAGIWMYQDGNGSKMHFGTSSTFASGITNTAMTIAGSPNGFVGINNTSPSYQLDVTGDAAIRSGNSLYFYTSDQNRRGTITASESSPHLRIHTSGGEDISIGDGSHILVVEGSHNRVGINTTTPTVELDVRGNMRVGDGTTVEQDIHFVSANGGWQAGTNNSGNGTSGNQFYIYDNNYTSQVGHDGYSLAVQRGSGNIGIGTRSPGARLDVMGADGATTMIRVGKSSNGSQGTGVLELTQDGLAGGGISYNGDLNPSFATDEIADYTCLYRMQSGVRNVVARWAYHSNQITFTGDIDHKGGYLYTDGWFTNRTLSKGLYNTVAGNHFYADDARYWNLSYNGTSGGLRIRKGHNGPVTGYLYGDDSKSFGLLDEGGSWAVKVDNDTSIDFRIANAINFRIGANAVTGDYGTVQVDTNGKGSWSGYSINGRSVFMHNNNNDTGIYNDVDNEWFFKAHRNGNAYMYCNGTARIGSTPDGATIYGSTGYALTVNGNANAKILLEGAADPYIRFREGSADRAYIQWRSQFNELFMINQQANQFTMRGSTGVNLRFEGAGGAYLGSVHADSSKNIGLLDKDGNWAVMVDPDTETKFNVNNSHIMSVKPSGLFFPAGKSIIMSNNDISGVNRLTINDHGEGITFGGGNGWHIHEAPNSLADAAGNIQIIQGSTRRATFNTSGQMELPIGTGTSPLVISSTTRVSNLNSDLLDGYHASSFINSTHTSNGKSNLAPGWYTIAVNAGDRAIARFGIRDLASSRHQTHIFYASHHFASSELTHIAGGLHNVDPFRYLRIKTGGTYDGAMLQVYVDNSLNNVNAFMLGDNIQSGGWTLVNWIPDTSNPGIVNNYSALNTIACTLDLNNVSRGGISTSGDMFCGGDNTQYRVLHTGDYGDGNGIHADILDGFHASTGANAGTIVARDAGGDTNHRYVFSQYLNMSHGASDRNSDTTFYSSTDNYLRKNTVAGMRSSLGIPTKTGSGASGTWSISIYGNAATATWADQVDVNLSDAGSGDYKLAWTSGDTVYASNHFKINRNSKTLSIAGDVIAFASDERLKENITLISNPLEKLAKISGYNYNFNEKGAEVTGQPQDKQQVGVLAQEIEKVCPEVIEPAPGDSDYKTVKYDKLVPLLIESIKAQQSQIDTLKQEIEQLKQQ